MPALKPTFRDVEMLGNNRSARFGAIIAYFLLHTEEGSATAENLARSGNNSGAFSYHYIVDDGTRVPMVDTDFGSWSVLDANNRSINLCFAGSRAAQSREVWLSRFRNAIRIAAWTVAEDAKKYKTLNPRVVNPRPFPKGNVPCVSDHYFVTKVLGIGDHSDVGPNFPWDVFTADLNSYLDGVTPEPVVNEIDECEKWNAANPGKGGIDLGKRLTAGEQVCPDKVGRWARFERGFIYWSPSTGAFAIPPAIFETWGELGFEKGYGYPVNVSTVVNGGTIQAFERAVIYRKDGQKGWPVRGEIFKRFQRDGYEPVDGWPTGDEYKVDSGLQQDFEHTSIRWVNDKNDTTKIGRA